METLFLLFFRTTFFAVFMLSTNFTFFSFCFAFGFTFFNFFWSHFFRTTFFTFFFVGSYFTFFAFFFAFFFTFCLLLLGYLYFETYNLDFLMTESCLIPILDQSGKEGKIIPLPLLMIGSASRYYSGSANSFF